MIFLQNRTQYDIDTVTLDSIASTLTDRDIELVLCDDEYIKNLNSKYRSKESATDVLSFPLEGDMKHMPLGAIVISVDHAITGSREFDHDLKDEILLLFIHGLLHLMGYDHEIDEGQMREKEREIISRFDLPSSLIVRTDSL